MLFLNKPYFPSKLTICMISFTSLLKIINVAVLDPSIFLSIFSSVSDAVVVNAKFIKKLIVMILKMHLETLLIVLFYATGFLRNYSTLTVLFGKSKTVSFASSIMKNIFVCPLRFRFAVEFIHCITLRLASSTCCLLKPTTVIVSKIILI